MNAQRQPTRNEAVRPGYTDPRTEFVAAMRAAGVPPVDTAVFEPDGRLTRFQVEGDKHGSRNGWAVLHVDGQCSAGGFGSWRSGVTSTWRSGRGPMDAAERARLRDAIQRAERQRDEERSRRATAAAQRAAAMWGQSLPADPQHPYLVRKHIQPHGVRQSGNLLLIPMRDAAGCLRSLQTIAPDGAKRFLRGGIKRSMFYLIGDVIRETIICEGFATGASIREATGRPVAVALDAGNLEPVARALRAKFPKTKITIAGDNDTRTAGNPGLTHARAAAQAVGGYVAIPPWPFNDWNDCAVSEAVQRVGS